MRSKRYLLLVFFFSLFWACDSIDDPGLINPLNPNDDEYIPPALTIVSGPQPEAVLNDHSVQFEWAGNEVTAEFSTHIDALPWSPWLDRISVEYSYLDEGAHTFAIKGRNAVGEDTEIYEIPFMVDAVEGPAIRFFPRRIDVVNGEDFTVEIVAEEIQNLASMYLELPLTTDDLSYVSHEIYTAADSFLGGQSAQVMSVIDSDAEHQLLRVYLGRVSNQTPTVSGTGAVMQVTYTFIGSSSSQIAFGEDTQLKDAELNDIPIRELVSGILTVN